MFVKNTNEALTGRAKEAAAQRIIEICKERSLIINDRRKPQFLYGGPPVNVITSETTVEALIHAKTYNQLLNIMIRISEQ